MQTLAGGGINIQYITITKVYSWPLMISRVKTHVHKSPEQRRLVLVEASQNAGNTKDGGPLRDTGTVCRLFFSTLSLSTFGSL